MTLEEYDIRREAARLRSLEREMEMKERQGLAVQAALSEHAVTSYIKNLPVESALYPAIEYLRSAPEGQTGTDDGIDDPDAEDIDDVLGISSQEIPVGQEGQSIQEGPSVPDPYRQYIEWCMPAHDIDRPHRKGCGFIRSRSGGIVYSSCPTDHEHFIKGKRIHCWSLRCPQCMNDPH